MLQIRVIPCLLLKNDGLVKSIKFKDLRYIGDPINAVKIFSEKEVSELIFLDIMATRQNKKIPMDLIIKIAEESYMPFSIGGGIRSIDDIKNILYNGAEKVVINTAAFENPHLVKEASRIFGNQSIVVSIDVKKKLTGNYEIFTRGGTSSTGMEPLKHALYMEEMGAGELMINSIDRDGTMQGYDINLVRQIADAVSIPVIACGGAGKIEDLAEAVNKGHASAVAAGSFFIYHGPLRGILINFPSKEDLEKLFLK
jgi:cyclase